MTEPRRRRRGWHVLAAGPMARRVLSVMISDALEISMMIIMETSYCRTTKKRYEYSVLVKKNNK